MDDILNIKSVYFDNVVSQINPSELQLNQDYTSDTESAFLDLHLSISNDIISTKTYDKRDDFDFEIVNDLSIIIFIWRCSRSTSYVLGSISLNSFVFLEQLAKLLTSALTINY